MTAEQNNTVAQEGNNEIIGVVKWYSGQKAYGFITALEENRDYFVHFSDIISDKDFKCLFEKDYVKFEGVKTPKGWKATKVRVIPNPQKEDLFVNSTVSEEGVNEQEK